MLSILVSSLWKRLAAAIKKNLKRKATFSIKISSFLIVMILLSMLGQVPATAKNNTANQANQTTEANKVNDTSSPDSFGQKAKLYDASFAISVKTVLYRLKKGRKITLVDVRSAADFERLKIPGSINVPLFAVKTKPFLKSNPLVLVNEGYGYSPLEMECRRLKKAGYKVSILDGGLPAWRRADGALLGDLFALQDMKRVSSQTFFKEKDYDNGLVVDISSNRTKDSKQLIPSAVHLPFSDKLNGKNVVSFRKKLRQIAKDKNRPFSSVMIFDQDEAQYEQIQALFANSGLNIFYLKDGLVGYKNYLHNLTLSWQPREARTKRSAKCSDCGQKSANSQAARNDEQ